MPKGNLRASTNPVLLALGSLLVGFYLGRTIGTGERPTTTALVDSCSRSLEKNQETDSLSLRKEDKDWHAVHVHVGDRDHYLEPHLKTSGFSQEGQDQYALNLLNKRRGGYFVDLAANHPIKLSNMFLLERDYDWNGLCIEPNWQYWNTLATMRRCQVIGAVAGFNKELVQFRFHPFKRFVGAFGGIVGDQFDNKPTGDKEKNKELMEEARFTVALADILELFHAPLVIDYLSLDVEGAEELILSEFPFDRYTFLVMNVERPGPKVKDLLTQNGYQQLRTDRYGDTIWKHKSLETSQ